MKIMADIRKVRQMARAFRQRLKSVGNSFRFKQWEKLSFQHQLLILFTMVLTLAIGFLGGTTYLVAQKEIRGLTEDRLMVSAKNIAETVEFYTSTVDSREFNGKVEYLLNRERANFTAKGLKPILLLVDNDAKPTMKADSNLVIPQKILREVCTNDLSIKSIDMNGTRYSMASQFIPGKSWYYVIALQEQEYLAKVYQLRNLALCIGLAALVVAILLCRVAAKKFADPLQEIMVACGQASQGDLTVRVKADKMSSEFAVLGESFNTMLEDLEGILKQIHELFDQVNCFNKRIAAVAENQVHTVEQTGTTVREVAISVDTIGREMISSKNASGKMLQAASRGEQALQEINQVIDRNARVIEEQVVAFRILDEHIQKIRSFMQLIQEISAQTNLLSLNASIEAARAGEQGRGFSVVAQEVKKLADRSSDAATEVAQLVVSLSQQSNLVTNQMGVSKKVAEQGVEAIRQSKSALQEISYAIHETNDYIQLITESVENISAGSEQMVAMLRLLTSEEIQEDGQASEEAREASAREIAALANRMDHMTEQLKTGLSVFKFTQN